MHDSESEDEVEDHGDVQQSDIERLKMTVRSQQQTIRALTNQKRDLSEKVSKLEAELELMKDQVVDDALLPEGTKKTMHELIKDTIMPHCKFWNGATSSANQEVIKETLETCGITDPTEVRRLMNDAMRIFSKEVNYFRTYYVRSVRNAYKGTCTIWIR